MHSIYRRKNVATTIYLYLGTTGTYASGFEPATSRSPYGNVSIDGGTPTYSYSTVTELSSMAMPGVYKVALTADATNGDIIVVMLFDSAGYRSLPMTIYTDTANVPLVGTSAELEAVGILCTSILADTGTTLPATLAAQNVSMTAARNEIAVIDAVVDTEVAAIKAVVDSILVDTATTLNDKIDVIDGIVDAILVDTAALDDPVDCNVTQVSGSSTAADNMELGALAMVAGISHNSPTPTTETFASDTVALSATNNFYNGRILIFTSGTLAGQARTILDYTGSSKVFSCDAFTAAPPNDSNFIVV